jgi:hypothetical protein
MAESDWQTYEAEVEALEDDAPPRPQGMCAFCKQPTTTEDYCFGCREHVCDACDRTTGEETPEAHSVARHHGPFAGDA